MALSLIPSSSSSNTPQLKYDVFISFRGEDTRSNFTSHLHKALHDKQIDTFIDDELNRGDEISASLLEAIEKSQISVIVFSRDYASSKWCLDELVKIRECRENNEQIVIPVFYGVDPSDVRHQTGRHQTGSFAKAFAEHEKLFKESLHKVQRWKDALKETANLSGWDSSTFRSESMLIEAIVQDVLEKTNRLSSPDTSHLVGIDSKIKKIELLLSNGTNNVRSVGIWGIGGIGKTSLAESVFNKISHQFEGSYFCRNVREQCEQSNGLHHLQRDLVSALLGGRNENIGGTFAVGRPFIKNRLGRKKLLIVFDDVSDYKKIEDLIGGFDCLGPQSRIIMTTRDLQVLRHGGVDQVYEVQQLSDHEALVLFSRHAFRRNHPTEDYMALSERVAKYARGIPLALKVLGSHLLGRRKEVWVSAIDKLETIPHKDIQKVLKISYDGLEDEEKNIFLDIAHFFKMSGIEHVKAFIEACGFHADIGINVLIDKSLITMSVDDKITMHDLLQAMAREIVRQESIDDPGKRSRLWNPKDINHVLTKNSGTETVRGISLDMSKIGDIHPNPRAIANMHELRFLNFYNSSRREANKVHVSKALEFDFPELRYLTWHGCPIKSLLSSFLLENLVELDMSYIKVEQLWNGVQHHAKLKKINLGFSSITICPDISCFPNLEILNLESCKYLHEISSSFQDHEKLDYLDISGCSNLEILPEMPRNLGFLFLDGTVKGDTAVYWFLPRIVECHNMTWLDLSDCGITNLPDNLDCLSSLNVLYLAGNSFESIPTSIINLSKLVYLDIQHCEKLKYLPALQLLEIRAFGCTSVLQCLSILKNVIDPFTRHFDSSYIFFADFGNCCNLDPNIMEDIVKDALWKIRDWLDVEDDEAVVEYAFIRYSGSEIPKWFDFRSNGSFISVGLPPDWFAYYKYVGFVLSVVVAPCLDHEDDLDDYWCIHWNCNLKSKEGDTCVRTGILEDDALYNISWNTLELHIHHVLVDSYVDISPNELLFYDDEITFHFFIPHDMRQHKVEKCGVHLMFAQHFDEVDGSSRISEDEDVLLLENAHDNCEEEDELIKVSGSRKRKRNRSKMERKKKRPRHPLLTSSFGRLCRHLQ